MRVTSAPARKARKNKIRKATKGMGHTRRASTRMGTQAVIRSLQYQYRARRTKKRDFRKLWIQRINAAARENGTTYSALIKNLAEANIKLDRKVLADIAVSDPKAFSAIVNAAKK